MLGGRGLGGAFYVAFGHKWAPTETSRPAGTPHHGGGGALSGLNYLCSGGRRHAKGYPTIAGPQSSIKFFKFQMLFGVGPREGPRRAPGGPSGARRRPREIKSR